MITCLTKQHDLKMIKRNSSVKGIHKHLIFLHHILYMKINLSVLF